MTALAVVARAVSVPAAESETDPAPQGAAVAPSESTVSTEEAPEGPATAETTAPAARVQVTGLGWLENLRMRSVLRLLRPSGEAPATYDGNAIEDGAFLLRHHVQDLGFLRARVRAELTLDDGREIVAEVATDGPPPFTGRIAATRVRYVVEPGRRYHYTSLRFVGLESLREETARAFFVRSDGLLKTRALRRFSRRELDGAVAALRTALQSRGHAEAEVRIARLDLEDSEGAVTCVIEVREGPVHRGRNLEVVVRDAPDGPVVQQEERRLEEPLSRVALEDLEQDLLVQSFREGYPDATCRLAEASRTTSPEGEVHVNLRAEVIRGPRVRLGTPRFRGAAADRGEALARKTRLKGPWLDRLAVDEARSRLARLGAFRFVNVRYDLAPEDPGARDPVFELAPGRQWTVDVLAGFRSYELLYGGVEVSRRNLFGLGHVADLRLVQSFRSSEGYLAYSIPDTWIDGLTLFGLADALTREEVSFEREELRLSVGGRLAFEGTGHQAGIRYNYEFLRALDAPVDVPRNPDFAAEDQPQVASVTLDWTLDRRDSAVTPRQGYRLGASLEVALPGLGGEARYLRPELEAAWHRPLGGGRFLGIGARHLLVVDPEDGDLIPFNKRAFPGGEDSVRGYQRGEAGPLNRDGDVIGAESALVWNIELEQRLTPSWSLVGFVDGVAQTADLERPPWDEVLWSAGGGLRWNTVVGPVRLEYGHNLTPRDPDPRGTVHFSVGFPF